MKVICGHEDSVVCVRFDEQRLVSCLKGRFLVFVFIFKFLQVVHYVIIC